MAVNACIDLLVALKELKKLKDLCDEEELKEKCVLADPVVEKRQHQHSLEAHLLKDLLWESSEFTNYCRITIDDFEKILSVVDEKIKKQDTIMRLAITSRLRLAITLRFIGTGDSYRAVEFLSKVSRKTIGKIVPEVLEAIIECLEKKYLKLPSTVNEWKTLASGFQYRWQFPHTLGAIDGKHIRIKAPPQSGDFYKFNGFFSVAFLAVVDCNSRFIYIDVGANGASDAVVLKNSSLYKSLKKGSLNIPPDEPLPGQVSKTSYFFVADDIFELDRNMIIAYNRNSKLTTSQENFNYRLSRARMPVEMAFGRLADRFRIFHRPLDVQVNTCDLVVKACCILHNYLTKSGTNFKPSSYENQLPIPELPETFSNLPQQRCEAVRSVSQIRDNIKNYLVSDVAVPFQWKKAEHRSCESIYGHD